MGVWEILGVTGPASEAGELAAAKKIWCRMNPGSTATALTTDVSQNLRELHHFHPFLPSRDTLSFQFRHP